MRKLMTLTMLLTSLTVSAQSIDQQALRKVVSNIRIAQKENLKGNSERVNESLTRALMTMSQFTSVSTESTQIKATLVKSMASKEECNADLIASSNAEHPDYSLGNTGYWKQAVENKLSQKCAKDGASCNFDSIRFETSFKSVSNNNSVIGTCEIEAIAEEEI